ncbi:unnamed protein product [Choristocarpus tenellus]
MPTGEEESLEGVSPALCSPEDLHLGEPDEAFLPGGLLVNGQQGDHQGALKGKGERPEGSPIPQRTVRRQFSLDLNIASPTGANRIRESKSREELAAILTNSSLVQLVEMDEDVELGPEVFTSAPYKQDTERERDIMAKVVGEWQKVTVASTSSPVPGPDPNADSSQSPSQILFTHEEIVVLKLLFSLFDRKGKNFITRDDIVAYAEEGGDYAQLREVDACMEAVDADGDGKVGLADYINFAARLKEIYNLQVEAGVRSD